MYPFSCELPRVGAAGDLLEEGLIHRLIGVAMGALPRPEALGESDDKWGHRRVYDWAALRAVVAAAGLVNTREQGVLLKAMTTDQLGAFSPDYLAAASQAGRQLPQYAAALYCLCQRAAS